MDSDGSGRWTDFLIWEEMCCVWLRIGEIEFEEFARVMAASFFKKYSQDELRTAFRQFDADGSGYIQANELEDIMRKMGRRFNKDEISSMVKSLDSSGDGKISFEEFVLLFK